MKKILLIEDTYLNRVLIKKILLHAGFEVIEAENGEEGIQKAWIEHPDLILMDLSMPVMDGWSALAHLRSCEESCKIPVIAVTAHAMPEDRIRILNAGFNDYITKPIDVFQFVSQIEPHMFGGPKKYLGKPPAFVN